MSLAIAREQIAAARQYTLDVLAQTDDADWFRMPSPAVTHIAWQVGHLAVAEYRLTVAFLREPRLQDHRWMPEEFLALFRRDTVPQSAANVYPTPVEIRSRLGVVHAHVLAELAAYDDAELDAPALMPHRFVKTKRDALLWCSRHESVHAGQIALLRRLHGQPPMW